MVLNNSKLDCTIQISDQFIKIINQHEFFLENQIQTITNDAGWHYRLYILKLINITNVQQLEAALIELKNNKPANHFQDDYDLGVFLEGFDSVFPKILAPLKLSEALSFIFLIDIAK